MTETQRREKKSERFDPKLLDELLASYEKPEDILGEGGLLQQLTKALLERALQGELTHHLGYEKHSSEGKLNGNSRNGFTNKRVKGKRGTLELEVPRDRDSSFEPQLIKKHQTRFDGLDEKIIALYARGLSTRDIQSHLEELYSVEVSPELISSVTDSVLEEVREWQTRPLDKVYPILWLDGLVVKVRRDGRVSNRVVYVALAVNIEGQKEVLGLWMSDTEGAKFWLSVITELKNRGVEDIFIACVDGLKGFSEAIESVYPQTEVQLCIVHQVRHSLSLVSEKDRKEVASDLKLIYRAATTGEAELRLEEFEEKWNTKYPIVVRSWRNNWSRLIPFFAFPAEIRRVIYTTNAIESLNYSLRRVIKNRSLFPTDDAVYKLLFLAIRNASKRWTMPIRNWRAALQQFAIVYGDRVPLP